MKKMIFKKITVMLVVLVLFVTSFSVSAAKSKIKNPIYRGTITVDGEIDEVWKAVDEIKLTFYVQGDESSNAGGYGKLLWDDKFIYVLGVVTDSTPTTAFREGQAEWNHDSFEIFLDETNEKIDKNSMTQFRISSLGRVSGQYLDTVVTEAQLKEHYPQLKTAHKANATGYVVEFAIPWTRQTKPTANTSKLGFCLQINDDVDNAETAEGIATTPVPSRFNPALYPTYTIVSESAEIEKKPTESKPSTEDGKTGEEDKTASAIDGTEETVSGVEENTANENNQNSEESQKTDSDNTSKQQMDPNAFMLIVLGAVIVLCLIGIILVYIFVLRASPKK